MSTSPTGPAPDHPTPTVVLRPVGTPLPLGLLALAGGTLVLAGLQLGWVPPAHRDEVGLVVLGFVLPLQLLAAVVGLLARDAPAGAAMGVLAGTWAAIGLVQLDAAPGATSDALGLLLVASAACLLVPAAGAVGSKRAVAGVLLLTALRFAVTGVQQLSGSARWETVAGIVGLVLAAVALAVALGLTLEDARRRTVVPLGRVGPVGELLDAPGRGGVEREAGVRSEL